MGDNEPANTHYVIDGKRSRFTVQAFSGGLLSAFAHNPVIGIRGMAGEAVFSPDRPETASLNIKIKADSLEVMGDVSAKDRQEMERQTREDVLETSRYGEIVFTSTAVSAEKISEGQYRAAINGELMLHGVTNKLMIPAQIVLMGDSLRASGEFTLNQSDYNIKQVTAVGGTIKLKDELKFSFDLIARKQ